MFLGFSQFSVFPESEQKTSGSLSRPAEVTSMGDLRAMRTRELKKELESMGISTEGCVDKEALLERLEAAGGDDALRRAAAGASREPVEAEVVQYNNVGIILMIIITTPVNIIITIVYIYIYVYYTFDNSPGGRGDDDARGPARRRGGRAPGGFRSKWCHLFGRTLQSRASGLQSTTQGNSVRTKRLLPVKQTKHLFDRTGETPEVATTKPGSFAKRIPLDVPVPRTRRSSGR